MIFYYAVTNYHILNCILHRLKYNKDKKAILYVSKWHPEHLVLIKNIKKTKFFDRVLVLDEVVFPSGNSKIGIKRIKSDIEYINKEISDRNRIDFDSYEEINVCGDHYGLSIYLNYNGINYNYFEDGCGILSNLDLLMNNIKKIDYSRYQILKYLDLPGSSKYVLKRFGDLNSQLPNYYNNKDIHFSVKEELEKIGKITLKKMISIFDDSFVIDDFNDYDILLTFHYNNLGIMSLEEQRLFYSYLLDFFGHDKIVIKPHPSDIQGKYQEWFPMLRFLPRKMPSEFLPLLVRNNFNNAITGWSTSVNGLKGKVKNIVIFDQQIDYKYKIMLKYYMISQFIVNLLGEDYAIICYGFNVNYIKNFIDCYKNDLDYQYYFYDDMSELNDISGKRVIIFDKVDNVQVKYINNIDNDAIVFEIEDINNSILKNDNLIYGFIEKNIIDDENHLILDSLKYDCFSCVVKNKFLKKEVLSFKFEKNLYFANIKSSLFFNTDSKKYILDCDKKNRCIYELKQTIKNINNDFSLYKDVSLNKIEDLKKQLNTLNDDIVLKKKEIVNLKKELNDIKSSNSWKMTKWYRVIGKKIKKIIYKS